ncbi:mitogen-activated protein kinase 15 [Schistocerca serialis cubense]|uniref:mitogen-activated protein kinase 15 n=1 Tax=Schistocerca serialis cubense TaxID=2023355 RepID=UPI00214EB752|nr:mitogen-activated protein kinase 15 [Schistocerca serialis cubense]
MPYLLLIKSMSEVDAHITRLYQIEKRLGQGAYGIVWKALDKKTKKTVAVKKIYDAFRNKTDAQRTFREIMFLQEFGEHPNVIKLLGIHKARNNRDIYLVFEYMDTDLHNVIKRGNILKDVHKRYIMYQLLKATKYIHSGNVIHRDQKPSNILLDSECHCKVADFGLARSLSQLDDGSGEGLSDPPLTDYVATRWYRAPEILVASKRYTHGIDMWSLGCILAEMLLGKPLFPGSSTINQMERIMSALPTPSKSDLKSIFAGYGSSLLQKPPPGPHKSLRELLSNSSPDAVDLVCRLVVFNPDKRLTAEQALEHPYVLRFHDKDREPKLKRNVLLPLRDDVKLSVDDYRRKLYELMDRRKHHDRPRPLLCQCYSAPGILQRPLVTNYGGTLGFRYNGHNSAVGTISATALPATSHKIPRAVDHLQRNTEIHQRRRSSELNGLLQKTPVRPVGPAHVPEDTRMGTSNNHCIQTVGLVPISSSKIHVSLQRKVQHNVQQKTIQHEH